MVLTDRETVRSQCSENDLTVKIFADGADKQSMLDSYAHPLVAGFTTNPSLMRRANITWIS